MKKITLTLMFQDGATRVAELSWCANRTQVVSATEMMRSELEQIVEAGLSEWVGPEENPTPRTTPSSDPRFLERLAAYLRRQFRFVIRLQENETLKRKDTPQWPRDSGPVRQIIEVG